jgi:hypothetical protein
MALKLRKGASESFASGWIVPDARSKRQLSAAEHGDGLALLRFASALFVSSDLSELEQCELRKESGW